MRRPLPVLILLLLSLCGASTWAAEHEVTRRLTIALDDVQALRIGLSEEDYDDLEVHWTIQLPAVATTAIHLGVGQVTARVGRTALDVYVGVGEVNITGSRLDVGEVEVSSGVGSASLHGAGQLSSHRAFVAESAEGAGEGEFDMQVSVGVGDASVLLVVET